MKRNTKKDEKLKETKKEDLKSTFLNDCKKSFQQTDLYLILDLNKSNASESDSEFNISFRESPKGGQRSLTKTNSNLKKIGKSQTFFSRNFGGFSGKFRKKKIRILPFFLWMDFFIEILHSAFNGPTIVPK